MLQRKSVQLLKLKRRNIKHLCCFLAKENFLLIYAKLFFVFMHYSLERLRDFDYQIFRY